MRWTAYANKTSGAQVSALQLTNDDIRNLRGFAGMFYSMTPGDYFVHYSDGSIRFFTRPNFEKAYEKA